MAASLVTTVASLTQKLEVLMRGGTSGNTLDLNSMKAESYSLLERLSSLPIAQVLSSIAPDKKNDIMGIAVKLHNKARNLAATTQLEMKSVLKACAAWLLYHCGEDKIKVLSTVIKIFSKAGQELLQFQSQQNNTIQCFSVTIRIWNKAVDLSIHRDLAPVDLQDVRIAVFWAHCEKAKLLHAYNFSQEEIRKDMLGALELVQTLPASLRYSFATRVMTLGTSIANEPGGVPESLKYFKVALNTLDSILMPVQSGVKLRLDTGASIVATASGEEDDADDGEELLALRQSPDVVLLRVNALLSLAYVYMDMK